MADHRDMVLWDGQCGFCRRGMHWFKKRDSQGQLDMVPFQEAPSPPMTPELALECEKALYIVHPDGSMTRAGRAILYLFATIGYRGMARFLGFVPFVWGVELGYWLVARNRYLASRLFFTREEDGA